MTELELFQKELLYKLGYDIAPFEGGNNIKYAYLKNDKLHFLDKYADKTHRFLSDIRGDILVKKDDEGFHYCPSNSKDGEPITYSIVYGTQFYILWENDEYTDLSYLSDTEWCKEGDTFEYFKKEHYLVIKFHKEKRAMLDAVISQDKDIYHLGVFVTFVEGKIIVCDYDEGAFVYDEEMNILYRREGDFDIFEKESKQYLIFPRDRVVYNLSDGEEFKLLGDDSCRWLSIRTYGYFFVLYKERRYNIDKTTYCDYTEGGVYDINFKPLRSFNVLGKIEGITITSFSGTIVMKVDNSDDDTCHAECFNIYENNKTRYCEEIDKELSVPDMVVSSMDGYENLGLAIVKAKTYAPDTICFNDNNGDGVTHKCGVYQTCGDDSYNKVLDCKYDYIKPLPLMDDDNVYYLGIMGRGTEKKCDLYINHKLFFQNYPFDKEHNTKVVGKECFIQFANTEENVGLIRNGEIVFKPQYKEVTVYVHVYDSIINQNGKKEIDYLIIVGEGELYGLCSHSGELILPIEYSILDVDDYLDKIVLGRTIERKDEENEEDENEDEESILWDYLMEVGRYSKFDNSIKIKKAKVKNGAVQLDYNYIWDGEFKYTDEGDDY